MAKQIRLTQGCFATVDDDVFDALNQHKWCVSDGYAVRHRQGKHILMHRVITNAPPDFQVDHVDGNRLNNIRSNLRLATQKQNMQNRKPMAASGYKGVTYRPERKRYRAVIRVAYKLAFLGYYKTAEEAARAYDKAARVAFGEFAHLNFPAIHT